jgi:hypothetical protein
MAEENHKIILLTVKWAFSTCTYRKDPFQSNDVSNHNSFFKMNITDFIKLGIHRFKSNNKNHCVDAEWVRVLNTYKQHMPSSPVTHFQSLRVPSIPSGCSVIYVHSPLHYSSLNLQELLACCFAWVVSPKLFQFVAVYFTDSVTAGMRSPRVSKTCIHHRCSGVSVWVSISSPSNPYTAYIDCSDLVRQVLGTACPSCLRTGLSN